MADEKRQTTVWVAAGAAAVVVIILIIWAAVKRPENPSEPQDPNSEQISTPNVPSPVPNIPIETSGKSLSEVVQSAATWAPTFKNWAGRPAPNFELTDLQGDTRKLSDYRGKSVLLVFWATWCPPCKMEIPHLIETRNTIPKDELAILAISTLSAESARGADLTPAEHRSKVQNFAQTERINYTVLLGQGSLPAPYNAVQSIPASFFIDPQGNIKLATIGPLQAKDIKDVLQAQ